VPTELGEAPGNLSLRYLVPPLHKTLLARMPAGRDIVVLI
jgi:hypothetical protein